ncbi:tudor domain-containing protein 3 [Dorcoceras hygrometricum]|uniref:Tudor domain-containing protein 3 n=1 Tax=Dorcoceras hygrometricum TaxID=472368 RepID=A0A2Z7B6E7_9LAMI|nr:tudor domain-containing protein 3 [Dorcoceras hygrometricum]
MPPRRRGRGGGQFQEESEGQNEEEAQRSVPRRGHGRQIDLEIDELAARVDDMELVMGRGGSSRGRSFPAQQQRLGESQFRLFQQPDPSRFGQSSHPQFSGPQFAQVNAMTRDQAEGTPDLCRDTLATVHRTLSSPIADGRQLRLKSLVAVPYACCLSLPGCCYRRAGNSRTSYPCCVLATVSGVGSSHISCVGQQQVER